MVARPMSAAALPIDFRVANRHLINFHIGICVVLLPLILHYTSSGGGTLGFLHALCICSCFTVTVVLRRRMDLAKATRWQGIFRLTMPPPCSPVHRTC